MAGGSASSSEQANVCARCGWDGGDAARSIRRIRRRGSEKHVAAGCDGGARSVRREGSRLAGPALKTERSVRREDRASPTMAVRLQRADRHHDPSGNSRSANAPGTIGGPAKACSAPPFLQFYRRGVYNTVGAAAFPLNEWTLRFKWPRDGQKAGSSGGDEMNLLVRRLFESAARQLAEPFPGPVLPESISEPAT